MGHQGMGRLDPRLYQIASLSGLLALGVFRLGFDISPGRIVLVLGSVLLTQYACRALWNLPGLDPLSPLISGLSLCLLLRSNYLALVVLAAVLTISSKFLLRFGGAHVFNPTSFGLVAMMLLTGEVWVSPGQWGSSTFLGFLVACLGGLVVNRALRSDVTYAFLAFHLAFVFGRALWLGDSLSIPIHQVQSGALLLFSFFMISDPKTTPSSRGGRIVFAFFVAWGAYFVQFKLFRPNGLLFSLAACSLFVPWINHLLPGRPYAWGAPLKEGARHEASPALARRSFTAAFDDPGRFPFLRLLRREG